MNNNATYRIALSAVTAVLVYLCPLFPSVLSAQVRDLGTRRLVLDNNAAGRITLQTQPTVTNNYSIAFPTDTAGAHRGLLLFTNAGAGALTTNFLASGSNGQILTVVSGTPTWATSPAWLTNGNTGTTAGTNFIGTTDNVAFEIHVDEAGLATEGRRRVWRVEPQALSPNIIGGYNANTLGLGVTAAGVFIGGGGTSAQFNRASDNFGVVVGGAFNRAGSNDATVNNASHATVVGGLNNAASAATSFVGGGQSNTASAADATVAGGANNQATGSGSIVGGGGTNVASGANSVIVGGSSNTNAGVSSSIVGGTGNALTAGGDYSSILGGRGLSFGTSAGSFGFVGNNSAGANNFTVTQNNIGFLGNVDLWLANNDGTARALRLYEPQATNGAFPAAGTNFVAFRAPVIPTTDDQTYILPAAIGTAGQTLRIAAAPAPTATLATLEWAAAAAASPYEEATAFQRNIRRISSLVTGPAGVPGFQATDLQAARALAGQTATANNSVITGGSSNTVSGQNAGIMSGLTNTVSSNEAFIGGGEANTVGGSAIRSVIGGGGSNTVSSNESFIGSGTSNNVAAAALRSVIVGGTTNTVGANYTAILGGQANTVNNQFSAIWGGQNLTLSANSTAGYNAGSAMTIATANTAVLGNVNLWIGRNDNTAPELRLYEPTSTTGAFPPATVNYVAFRSPVMPSANDNTYVLPAAIGTAGQSLRIAASPVPTSTTATLEWGDGAVFEEVTAGQGNVRRRLAFTNGTVGTPVGQYANDFQGSRSAAAQTATGNFSVIPGGQNNTVSGTHSLAFGHGANVAQNNTIVFNHPTTGDGVTRVGIDIDNPQTSLDIDGGLVVRPPANILVNANAFNVAVGNRSYLVLNPAGANRTGLILASGLQAGQVLVLRILEGQPNSIALPDAVGSNVNLSGAWTGNADDTITLIWSGTRWIELARSNN